MNVRFWKWFIKLGKEKVHEKEGGCQCKCPNCEEWTSNMEDGPHTLRWDLNKPHDIMTCGKCGFKSAWWSIYMIPAYDLDKTLEINNAK